MRRTTALSVILLTITWSTAYAQSAREVEFRDRPIVDILLALGELYGRSILADDTVVGRASCYLRENDIEHALAILLPAHGLYWWEDAGIIRVSRIRLSPNAVRGGFDVDADSADTEALIRRFSEASRTPIVCGLLSGRTISLHASGLQARAFMQIVQQRYPDVFVEWSGAACFVRRPEAGSGETAALRARAAAYRSLTVAHGRYALQGSELSFFAALSALARSAGKQLVFLTKEDRSIGDLHVSGKSFEEMFDLLLKLGACGSTLVGETYLVYDISDRDVLRQLDETVVVPLTHIQADIVPSLLPPDFAATNRLRVEPASNSVVLIGKPAEREPLERFLHELDHPPVNRDFYRFDLNYLRVRDFLTLLPSEFQRSDPLIIPERQSFILPLSADQHERLVEYIATVDRPTGSEVIVLKNLKVKELIDNLPPGIPPEEIRGTADPSTFFFVGDRSRLSLLRRQLAVLDRPRRQIRYELLVVQHRRGENEDKEVGVSATMLGGGERNAVLGSIGRLLSLRFDIVSAFGYLFALNLNAELATARARILADTTLSGISGEKITFRNTDTYRYRDALVNPETGHLDPTGVVREITSGLIIEIDGWASGANMITMNISSTISAQGTDTSGSANSLPATTEKVITTHVRTKSGTPVTIGGLLERSTEVRVDKIPLLGDIPLVGRLFRKRVVSTVDSELAVYILPHVEHRPVDSQTMAARLQGVYDRLIGGKVDG